MEHGNMFFYLIKMLKNVKINIRRRQCMIYIFIVMIFCIIAFLFGVLKALTDLSKRIDKIEEKINK
jgi:hypothetical protein